VKNVMWDEGRRDGGFLGGEDFTMAEPMNGRSALRSY
jgi:hypothetical protein